MPLLPSIAMIALPLVAGDERLTSDQKAAWVALTDGLLQSDFDYELSMAGALVREAESSATAGSGLELLQRVWLSEGSTEPIDLEEMLRAAEKLIEASRNGSEYSVNHRVVRAGGRVLQESMDVHQVHEVRSSSFAARYTPETGELVIGFPPENVPLSTPIVLIQPLPSDRIREWLDGEWSSLTSDGVYRCVHSETDSLNRSTVKLNDEGLPVAFWLRTGPQSDAIIAGFYRWGRADGRPWPAKALELSGRVDGEWLKLRVCSMRDWSFDPSVASAVLNVSEVTSVVDATPEVPARYRHLDELPKVLRQAAKNLIVFRE